MKIVHLTDIHLDHLAPRDVTPVVQQALESVDPSIPVVISGDIATGDTLHYLDAFETFGERSRQVYFVLGNHDAWKTGVTRSRNAAAIFARKRSSRFTYLPTVSFVDLGKDEQGQDVCLVGLDGWYDMRAGNVTGTGVYLNDFRLIEELKQFQPGVCGYDMLRPYLQERGARCARQATELLDEVLSNRFQHVIFATHVPPFVQAAKYKGKPTDAEYLPFFVNYSLGLALESTAASYPNKKITVLCGHTHDACDVQITDNLRCVVGAADYGEIKMNMMEV